MPRIQWDAAGERTFETGTDRGMLYAFPFPGVAWNGLAGVSVNPSGGTAEEYYGDGRKYLGIVKLEEYSAVIKAFSSPPEFARCSGFRRLSPGLLAGGQSKLQFGFSYRTLTGDDVLGISAGYKIHVVYNALVTESDFTQETTGDRMNVKPYSWTVTAVPEAIPGFRPSSYFVIDTRKTGQEAVSGIEDILYGTETEDPRIATPEELITLAGS